MRATSSSYVCADLAGTTPSLRGERAVHDLALAAQVRDERAVVDDLGRAGVAAPEADLPAGEDGGLAVLVDAPGARDVGAVDRRQQPRVAAATSSRTLRVTRLTLPAASSTSISMWFAPWTGDTFVLKVPSVAGRTSVIAFCPGNARTVIRPSATVTPLIRRSGCDAMTSPGGSVTSSRGGVANDVNW